jgi:hypothetical protein
MRSVRIADDVYAALQAMAVPFEDDINDVLRRLVQLAEQRNGAVRTRIPRCAADSRSSRPSTTPDSTGTLTVGSLSTAGRTAAVNTYRSRPIAMQCSAC